MNKGYINIIIIFFTTTLIIAFSIFILYSHFSVVVYNIRNDLFYFVQNSIINFSKDELGLENYSYNEEKIKSDIEYLFDKNYNNNKLSKNIVKNIKIKELKFMKKDENCLYSDNMNCEKIHIVIEVSLIPPILGKKLGVKKINLHEDVKFSLMEI